MIEKIEKSQKHANGSERRLAAFSMPVHALAYTISEHKRHEEHPNRRVSSASRVHSVNKLRCGTRYANVMSGVLVDKVHTCVSTRLTTLTPSHIYEQIRTRISQISIGFSNRTTDCRRSLGPRNRIALPRHLTPTPQPTTTNMKSIAIKCTFMMSTA